MWWEQSGDTDLMVAWDLVVYSVVNEDIKILYLEKLKKLCLRGFSFLYMYSYTTCMPADWGGQMSVWNPLGLEVQIVSCCVDAGNKTPDLCRISKCS